MFDSVSSTPAISIILPVYNAEKYLNRCIESIIGQTFKSFELIAVDDGSSDLSPQILDLYANQYPNQIFVHHKSNGGVAKARNFGVSHSKGDYICFIDNDDWFDPDFLEKLYSVATNQSSDLVCSGFRRPDALGKVVAKTITRPNSDWGRYIVSAAWAKLIKRSLIMNTNAQFLDSNIGEDIYFTLPLIQTSGNTTVIDYVGYNWFYNEESVSSTSHKKSHGLSFFPMMDQTLVKLRSIDGLNEFSVHYFIRLCVWYLLYTVKGDGFRISNHNLKTCYGWLSENLPNWEKDSLGSLRKPSGDLFINRVAVYLFIHCPSIFRLCLKLYGAL